MKNNDMEKKIRQAYERATPDVLDSVLSRCDEQKGTVIYMTSNKKNKKWTRFAAVAAALALVLGLGFGFNGYQNTSAITSTVSLDVNPSVELQLNRQERVIEVIAKNEDGHAILDGMNLVGSDVEVAVNALIGSMVRNGYLSELANSILVSVESQDTAQSAALQARLSEKVNQILSSDVFSGAVLSQSVQGDEALKALAQEHNISVGKAQLIQKILSQNTRYTFESLAALSINELNLLTVAGGHQLEGVNASGSASEKLYIGKTAARDSALTHAGLTVDDIRKLSVEMDLENGKMVYEVEFDTAEFEYEYDIDAVTGAVVKFEKEAVSEAEKPNNSADPNGPGEPADPNANGILSRDEAKAIVLTHAGLVEENISRYECELDRDDGLQIFEISFDANGYEYEYDINAKTGAVLSWEREAKRGENQSTSGSNTIDQNAAVAAALKHAGLDRDSIRDLECEQETRNGKAFFEISFQHGNTEYEYEIDAATGDVLKFEKEIDD